jgi:hypothetical protein
MRPSTASAQANPPPRTPSTWLSVAHVDVLPTPARRDIPALGAGGSGLEAAAGIFFFFGSDGGNNDATPPLFPRLSYFRARQAFFI